MKWTQLKEHLAPSFMKQIDQVCEKYISKYITTLIIFKLNYLSFRPYK